MEEEVRQILRQTLIQDTQLSAYIAESIQQRFAQLGGLNDFSITNREVMDELPQIVLKHYFVDSQGNSNYKCY